MVPRMTKNDHRERAAFLRDQQLAGRTRQQALEMWSASCEIADSFAHDGIRTAEDLSQGAIHDAIADWIAVREAGL